MNNEFGPFKWWRVFVAIVATMTVALATVLSVSILTGIVR